MKYVKKPIVIEAFKWGGNLLIGEQPAWIFEALAAKHAFVESTREDSPLLIVTLEGAMKARIGDWVIRGVNGELYPCKPDIFDKTYEEWHEIVLTPDDFRKLQS